MALASTGSFSFFVWPFFEYWCNRFGWNRCWDVRWIGEVTVSGIISLVIALAVVISWLVTYFWVITDLLAISLAVSAFSFVRIPNLKIASLVLVIFFLYDIFWVFISPLFFKKSVMVTVAVGLPRLPMIIMIPKVLEADSFTLLGLGDIVLPGLWLCFLYRFDKYKENRFGYFMLSWIFYILGLILTFAMLVVIQFGQPALLYLVPATLLPTVFVGLVRVELKQLWQGIPTPATTEADQALLTDTV
eukprot:TRINITY_DN3651_c0_g1_i1.p1 TRINITY_DN3651_c0_g1~~TRINITY_DN3651_c0_g1_i1.p1  ORF type:complete len:246 (-),score=52.28 TRINITY_DN3651_c0_g1_i1:42-779(-)